MECFNLNYLIRPIACIWTSDEGKACPTLKNNLEYAVHLKSNHNTYQCTLMGDNPHTYELSLDAVHYLKSNQVRYGFFFKYQHRIYFIKCISIKITFSRIPWMFSNKTVQFLFNEYLEPETENAFFWISYIGSEKDANEYEYTMELKNRSQTRVSL
jgi:hypothetical protein